MKTWVVKKRDDLCMNCKYFYQHYIFDERTKQYRWMYAGHCTYPRMKDREPFDTCRYFESKSKENFT